MCATKSHADLVTCLAPKTLSTRTSQPHELLRILTLSMTSVGIGTMQSMTRWQKSPTYVMQSLKLLELVGRVFSPTTCLLILVFSVQPLKGSVQTEF